MKTKKDYCSPKISLTLMQAEDIFMGASTETFTYGDDNAGGWKSGW